MNEVVERSSNQDREIVRMYSEDGMFSYEIAKKMGLPESTVRFVLHEHGILR